MKKPKRDLNHTTLPRGWSERVKSNILSVISLAQSGIMQARGQASSRRSPWQAERERLQHEVSLLREELRIKDARMAGISPTRRPHYSSTDRLAILELRAARSWSLTQTALRFLITPQTISDWLKRIDDHGIEALVQLSEPVNKFPQLVGYLVRRLKTLCPTLGTKKIAESLARAGLHLGATTVRRMIQGPPTTKPTRPKPSSPPTDNTTEQVVTAEYPNHVWHVDLTTVPMAGGFWTAWLPFSLPLCWPFCWWLAVVVDHYSRRIMGVATFKKQPTSADVQRCLARGIRQTKATPKYIICDSGTQFACPSFKTWCKRSRIRPRYGAIGKHGSIAVVERVILTLKQLLACLIIVPLSQGKFRHEVALLVQWYNEHRPHTTLRGRTPDEVYHAQFPANRKPRYEPRSRWPRGSPCAIPWALVRGSPGVRLELDIEFLADCKQLPIVRVQRAA